MALRSSRITKTGQPCEPATQLETPQLFRWLRSAFSCFRLGDSRGNAESTRQDPSFLLSNKPNQTEPVAAYVPSDSSCKRHGWQDEFNRERNHESSSDARK